MDLRPTRAGTEEAEFICSGDNVPFEISVVLPAKLFTNTGDKRVEGEALTSAKITFRNREIVGADSKQVKKFLDAMALLQPSGEIEIFDLKEDKTFFTARVELGRDDPSQQAYRRFVNDLVQIADRFKLNLCIPAKSKMLEEDLETVLLLKTYIESGSLPVGDISATVVKSEQNRDSLPREFATGGGHFRFVHPRQEPKPILFGVPVDTGPCAVEVEAQIVNLAATLEEFRNASIGDGVKMSFRPVRPARFSLLSDEEWSKV
jgi:hypothetical protein